MQIRGISISGLVLVVCFLLARPNESDGRVNCAIYLTFPELGGLVYGRKNCPNKSYPVLPASSLTPLTTTPL